MSKIHKKQTTTLVSESGGANDSYQNVLILNGTYDDEYDDCKDLDEELNYIKERTNTFSEKNSKAKRDASLNNRKESQSSYTRNPNSPMKRNKEFQIKNNGGDEEMLSPKKRIKMPSHPVSNNENRQSVRGFSLAKSVATVDLSPKSNRNSHSMYETGSKKTNAFASTPKSERRVQKTRVEELSRREETAHNLSAAVERNMSNNWGDILEELEEQTKELNEYVEKVSVKFKLDKDTLLKQLETDAEKLRKRQKHINFGKVTPEYQKYLLDVSRKNRQLYHPRTPNKFRLCSRRKFDGAIKKWRKHLHAWSENPDGVKDYKHSIEDEEGADFTEDFGNAISYIVDDYDLLDDDEIAQPKEKQTAK